MIQITAGKGPAECCRVVARLQEMLLTQARQAGIAITVLENTPGNMPGTLRSALMLVEGQGMAAFCAEWKGTVLWTAQSPYRKMHKRRNWFAGIECFSIGDVMKWNEKDVRLDTCRASGPGGQHVNKVETAVRGTHLPSGLQVLAMDSRSQLENKKQCLQRLETRVMAWQAAQLARQRQGRWQEHQALERGNALKTFHMPL